MSSSSKQHQKAVDLINQHGILLVFPINNAPEPMSLWKGFHPKTPLIWEWNETGDQKVFKMWMLMKELSDCKEVVYSKWYKGRATFFSRECFQALLHFQINESPRLKEAQQLFEELKYNSPLSTKELKKLTGLQGKMLASVYTKSMKELFEKFLIVAFGEVDDGAFPSLAVGATESLYEDLFLAAQSMSTKEAQKILDHYLPEKSPWRKFYNKI